MLIDNSAWFDYVASGTLDDELGQMRHHDRSISDAQADVAELFGHSNTTEW
jgi:hypothetical protein